jgi:ubiquinone biosynthesis protein Coq4
MSEGQAVGERRGRKWVDGVLREVKGWKAGLTLLRDPKRLDQVFALEEALADDETAVRMLAVVKQDQQGRRALAARPRVGRLELDELGRMPEGTLGKVFEQHMRTLGLDPAAIPEKEAFDDASYLRAHLYETHDLWHVLTGFGADIAGEVGLQAFYAAQLHGALPPFLVTGGLLHAVFVQPDDWEHRMEEITRGFALGRRARPVFGLEWRKHLTLPLGALRTTLEIEVVLP